MSPAWESRALAHITADPRLAEDIGADGWAPDASAALELCSTWTEDRVSAG